MLDLLALAAGLATFVRYGVGSFSALEFVGPYLLLTVPAIAAVASLAVLFDVTPGLRGRGGLVLWFFVFLFGLVKLPLDMAARRRRRAHEEHDVAALFDPSGIVTDQG